MLTVGVGSYGIACLACLGLVTMLLVGWITRHWTIIGLTAILSLWAVAGLGVELDVLGALPAYAAADVFRSAVLVLLLNHALKHLSGTKSSRRGVRIKAGLGLIACLLALALALLPWSGLPNTDILGLIGHIGLAVAGLFLIENLLQASRPDALWSTKHLLIGAGTIFAFDLFYYTDALLLLRIDDTLRAVQPVIVTLSLPLILVSARRLQGVKIDLPISRGLVVGTTALLASGIYILSVATIAYLIRELGWAWGPALQLIFLLGAAMVLLVLLSSTSLRHGGRRFIERNLFTFAYDYRREWLRMVDGLAGTPSEEQRYDPSLGQRALKATAALMDADGGALFMRNAHGGLHFSTSWNIALENKAPGEAPTSLLSALSPTTPAIVFDNETPLPVDLVGHTAIAEWLSAFRDPWIALALIARNEVVGLALITRPRMRRRLTWEDHDILGIFAHQLGSYLMVDELARHVAETEHFERMSKHVTFVAHDLKNVISQLSLVLQQAKDHAHNPAFVSDTFLTIGDAVERMKRLMQRVQEGAGQTPLEPVDLTALVKSLERNGRVEGIMALEEDVTVDAEPMALRALLDHLIDNAWEACEAKKASEQKPSRKAVMTRKAYLVVDSVADASAAAYEPKVALTLKKDGRQAVLEVTDRGIGMNSSFIETELFKPFRSTKEAGFGIGMYQCRDMVERWRGRLDVISEPACGTTMKVTLPLIYHRQLDTGSALSNTGAKGAEERAA